MRSSLALPVRTAALAMATTVALALLSARPQSTPRAAQAETPPRRVKTASTAAPAVDLGRVLQSADAYAARAAARIVSSDAASASARGDRTGSGSGDDGAQGDERTLTYLPGRVIVKFRSSATPSSRALATRAAGARQMSALPHANFELLEIAADAAPEQIAQQLAARDDVEYAQADYRIYPRFTPTDPGYIYQWHFRALSMEAAWDVIPGGSPSIIVAVLDTGVAFEDATFEYNAPAFRTARYRYPALGRITVPFSAAPDLASPDRFVAPRDFVWQDDDPVDLHGHGTHVAGTLAALTNNGVGGAGIAFNTRIMPVKVLSADWDEIFGAPGSGTDSTVAQGIRYAVDNGARVLNLSLGRSGPPAPVIEDALRYAVGRGAVVSIAAGNDYEQGNPDEVPALYGSRIEGVITVGAVGRDLTRAYYSAVKPYVEVSAPGGDYRARGNDGLIYQQMFDPTGDILWPLERELPPQLYRAPRFDVFAFVGMQGTSMAAPYVAGVAALLMQSGVTSPAAVESTIRRFASDRGMSGPDTEFGNGLVNPASTLRGRGLGLAR